MQTLVSLAVAMVGSIAISGIGAVILLKRPETNSLFVEDRFAFSATKILMGSLVIFFGLACFLTVFSIMVYGPP